MHTIGTQPLSNQGNRCGCRLPLGKMFFATVLLACCLLTIGVSRASTVVRATLDQVLQESAFVFEGRVISKETRLSPVNGSPFTYFTFEIIDVIKGSTDSDQIELGFMGGPKGDFVLHVTDMVMPKIGEKGVYFVESLSQQQVHPFYGWAQGHYLVIQDAITGREKAVPLVSEPNALIAAPALEEFKSSLRNKLGNTP